MTSQSNEDGTPVKLSDIPSVRNESNQSKAALRWKNWDRLLRDNEALEITAWAKDNYPNTKAARASINMTATRHGHRILLRGKRLFLIKREEER